MISSTLGSSTRLKNKNPYISLMWHGIFATYAKIWEFERQCGSTVYKIIITCISDRFVSIQNITIIEKRWR